MVRKNNLLVLKFYLIYLCDYVSVSLKRNELLFLKFFRNDVIVN